MKKLYLLVILIYITIIAAGQVSINDDNSPPDPSAGLDVKFDNKGFLPPRMNTTQRDLISAPAVGLMIFNIDCGDIQYYNGSEWVPTGNTGFVSQPGSIAGNTSPCANATGVSYSVNAVPGATGYHWTAPAGAAIATGQGTNAVTVNFGANSGLLCVAAMTDCFRSLVNCSNITLSPAIYASVSVSASATTVCQGNQVTLTATPVNGGQSPQYQWKKNNIDIPGATNTTYTYTPVNNDNISCRLTSNAPCVAVAAVYSNAVTMTVLAAQPVSVSVAASANNVCTGTQVTFTATPTNGGTSPAYQWKKNGNNIIGATNQTYTYSPGNGDGLSCTLTSNISCPSGNPATSNTVTMTVNQMVPVSVMVAASANPSCAGSSVTFTATPVNGGSAPAYQWKKSGNSVTGATNATYSYTPVNGNQLSCLMTSNVACPQTNPVTSNTVTMTVNPLLTPSLTIAASANPVCLGTSVIFTATPVNGGSTPLYQWKVNANNASNATNATYTYSPVQADVVTCVLSSNATCVTGNPATSNALTMTVTSVPVAPATGVHIPGETQVTWNWNAVSGSMGYKWNTTNDYSSATNLGTVPTKTETGLDCNTAYTRYLWAFNDCGNSTSLTITTATTACPSSGVPCPGIPAVSYGGKTYNTVLIGTQCWLKENLNIGTRINGNEQQANNGTIEKYCLNDIESNCEIFGGLYQWAEMVQYLNGGTNSSSWNPVPTGDVTGICPSGWHLPSDEDFTTLTNYLGGLSVAGGAMKETGTAHWTDPNTGATNASGFTAMGGGWYNGGFGHSPTWGHFWAYTENGSESRYRTLNSYNTVVDPGWWSKTTAHSVRCLKDTCTAGPLSPVQGTHIPGETQVIWNWNPVPGASGYKWNTTNNYATAIDMGTATTKTETGLTCGTAISRFAWAYNSCGNSAVTTLTATTSACPFTCSQSITVNHVVGEVAPVNKTTTYGTLTNIPGEESKCWITSNLGSDHQATAVNDATEASAGWYWQFNRKEGYKHDGTTLTPAWSITTIDENSDWQTENDPCYLELGTEWRLPTYTELYNVDNSGGWTNWNYPWNSGLKLHAAGNLSNSNGAWNYRGSRGYYWSSTQHDGDDGWNLFFINDNSLMSTNYKANGRSVRCLRD